MTTVKCAAAVLGVAAGAGATIGAGFVFVMVLASLRSAPSAMPQVETWIPTLGASLAAALIGGIAGALTGASAWFGAVLVLLLLGRRRHVLPVRATAVGVGGAVGTGLVLWFFAARPGVLVSVELVVALSIVAAGLAMVALLVAEWMRHRAIRSEP